MNLKRIKAFFKLIAINISIVYALLMITNLIISKDDITEEHIIVNVKKYGSNKNYSGVIDNDFHRRDGKVDSVFQITTGYLGDIKLERSFNSSSDKIDYLFMGGSTTACVYINPQMRFPFLINKSLDDSINVINLSKEGKHSHHSFLQLNTQLNETQINNLILMHNVNDLAHLLYFNSYTKGISTRRSVIEYDDLLEINKKPFYLPVNVIDKLKQSISQLYPNMYNNIKKVNLLSFLKNVDEFQNYRTKKNKIDEVIFKKFENNLNLFVSTTSIRGTNLILMTQFNRFTPYDSFVRREYNESKNVLSYENFIFAYERFNDIIRKVASENDLKLVDLDSLIPKNKEYMYDSVHLTEKGSVLVSEVILKHLE